MIALTNTPVQKTFFRVIYLFYWMCCRLKTTMETSYSSSLFFFVLFCDDHKMIQLCINKISCKKVFGRAQSNNVSCDCQLLLPLRWLVVAVCKRKQKKIKALNPTPSGKKEYQLYLAQPMFLFSTCFDHSGRYSSPDTKSVGPYISWNAPIQLLMITDTNSVT